jgi:type III restriction enzyme
MECIANRPECSRSWRRRFKSDSIMVKQSETDGATLYLVRETKSSTYLGDLRESKAAKIKWGKAH